MDEEFLQRERERERERQKEKEGKKDKIPGEKGETEDNGDGKGGQQADKTR